MLEGAVTTLVLRKCTFRSSVFCIFQGRIPQKYWSFAVF